MNLAPTAKGQCSQFCWVWRKGTPRYPRERTDLRTARRCTRTRLSMRKPKKPVDDDDILPEYDFSNGVRGKYYKPGRSPIRVTIEKDVARYYSSPDLVNAALRELIVEGRAP